MLRISVVIPTFNRALSVCEAIDSVLVQTRAADEIVVVDDGSTDNTAELLARYRDDIVLIRQPNQGVSAARNAGVAAAKGDWIAFLDSDDIWLPNRLAVVDRDTANGEAGVHVANLQFTGPGYEAELFQLRRLSHPSGRATLVADPLDVAFSWLLLSSVAVRREWFMKLGGLDTTMSVHEDTHLFCRLSQLGPWLVTSDIVARVRRLEGDTLALSYQRLDRPVYSARMWVKVYGGLLESDRLGSSQRELISRRLSGALFMLADAQAGEGQIAESRKTLWESARKHPTLKGWVKVFPPLLLGRRGYEFILGTRIRRIDPVEDSRVGRRSAAPTVEK